MQIAAGDRSRALGGRASIPAGDAGSLRIPVTAAKAGVTVRTTTPARAGRGDAGHRKSLRGRPATGTYRVWPGGCARQGFDIDRLHLESIYRAQWRTRPIHPPCNGPPDPTV